MQTSRSGRLLARGAMVLLLTLITAGCGRAGQAVESGATPAPIETAAPATDAPSDVPASSSSPVATPAVTVAPASVPTPDLSTVDRLLKDIDNDLNADASAGADEGSTP